MLLKIFTFLYFLKGFRNMTNSIDHLMKMNKVMHTDSESLRNVIRDHYTYLRHLDSTRTQYVGKIECLKYRFDYYGLLDYLGIPREYHFVVACINDIQTSTDFNEEEAIVRIPEYSVINNIFTTHLTGTRIESKRLKKL